MSAAECRRLIGLWEEPECWRATIEMERFRFGRGTYRYFSYPLPRTVQRWRQKLYAGLQPIAAEWCVQLGREPPPPTLNAFLDVCREAQQLRPTPLMLRYEKGDYNRLHQDLYGNIAFPVQVTVLLSRPGTDFDGGELLLVEQRPRAQSRGTVVPLRQGEGVAFAGSERPVQGARGSFRVQLRHGVSELRSGARFALGLIFHDAR